MATRLSRMPADQPMTDDIQLQTTPTIVIALGDSGIRDAEEIYEKAKAEGVEDRLLVIWINSRSEFPDHAVDGIKTFRLEKPDKQHIRTDINTRPYVDNDRKIRDLMGAKRNRDVARYYVDSPENISTLERFLRTRIKRFLTEFTGDPSINGPDGANVILTAGAGGGTGSGAAPLIAAMVDTITNELSAQGPLSTVNFHQWAIVSVATVQNTVSNGPVPDIKSKYLANTAALLSELRAMANAGSANRDIEIPLVSTNEGANLRRDSYSIDDNPFSGVYLMEYIQNSDKDTDSYRAGINETAAAVAFRWMRQDLDGDAVENAEDDLNHTFYEVRAVTFNAPTDTINELFDKRKQLDRTTARIQSLKETRSGLNRALQQVNELQSLSDDDSAHVDDDWLSDLSSDGDEVQADGGESPVARRARDLALKTATNLSPGQVSTELIGDRVETIQVQVAEEFHDAVPSESLLAVITQQAVVDHLAKRLESHSFPDEITAYVDDHADELEEFNEALDRSAPPLVQFTEVVRPYLKQRHQAKQAELDQTTILVDYSTRSDLKADIDEIERTLSELTQLASEFTRTQNTLEEMREQLERQRTELGDEMADLTSKLERIDASLSTARKQRDTIQSDRDDLRDQLMNPRMDRTVTLPVTDPNHIDPELFSDSPGLSQLWNQGVIDQTEAANHINSALRAEEGDAPLNDRLMTQAGSRSPAQGRPIVFADEDTMRDVWHSAEGDDKVTDMASSEYELDTKLISQQADDEFTILVEYGNIHFENFLHPIGVEAVQAGIHEVVGTEIDVEDSAAYPELLGLDAGE